mgnify:CR=1 FL=1
MSKLEEIMGRVPMASLIVFDGIARRCQEIVDGKEELLAKDEQLKAEGKINWFCTEALIRDAERILKILEE